MEIVVVVVVVAEGYFIMESTRVLCNESLTVCSSTQVPKKRVIMAAAIKEQVTEKW